MNTFLHSALSLFPFLNQIRDVPWEVLSILLTASPKYGCRSWSSGTVSVLLQEISSQPSWLSVIGQVDSLSFFPSGPFHRVQEQWELNNHYCHSSLVRVADSLLVAEMLHLVNDMMGNRIYGGAGFPPIVQNNVSKAIQALKE